MRKIILGLALLAGLTAVGETTYPRKQLLELFTSLKCSNCHWGHSILEKALPGGPDYVLMAHHSGFADDELTIPYSQMIASSEYYGCTGNPQLMLNRTIHPKYDNRRIFTFAYTVESTSVSQVKSRVSQESRIADVGISVKPVYYKPDNLLVVSVTLEKNSNLDENALLSVVLTEDNVHTTSPQLGQSGTASYIQNWVLRHTFTSLMGDKIKWDGDKYTKSFSVEVPKEWNINEINAIAFVGMPFSTALDGSPVLNAESNGDIETSTEKYADVAGKIAAPTGLKVDDKSIADKKGVILSWDPVEGAGSYDVLYHQVGQSAWEIETVEEPKASIKYLQVGKEYEWKVNAIAADGRVSEYSEVATFIAPDGSGVDSMVSNTDKVTVYTLQGVEVLSNADINALNNLPAGIYIMNGKKIVIYP